MALRKLGMNAFNQVRLTNCLIPAMQQTRLASDGGAPKRINNDLKEKVSFISGSTGGIGMSVARNLAAKGSDIILTGSSKKDYTDQLMKDFNADYGVQCHYMYADLSSPEAIKGLCTEVHSVYPKGIDILINNAGFQHVCPITEFPDDKWQKMIAVMLSAPFFLTKIFSPDMIEKKWGRIVNVSSAHGVIASPNKAAYVSAKHGIVGLTKVIALELATHGVTCNSVCPGYVNTPILQGQVKTLQEEMKSSYQEAEHAFVGKFHATQEVIELDHLADMIGFLCSKSAQQITGAALVIDGGWTAK